MQKGRHHSRVAVWSPWGDQPARTDRVAQADVDASDCALVIPFLPFDIVPDRHDVSFAGSNRSEGKEAACAQKLSIRSAEL